jgi:F-type H+/Na+-transporting ATPase subunit alpha
MPPDSLLTAVDRSFAGMKQAREAFVPSFSTRETGTITTVSTGIATVVGLPSIGFEELIRFPGDL